MSDQPNKSLGERKIGEVDQANLFEAPSIPEQQRMVEAILFASSGVIATTSIFEGKLFAGPGVIPAT